MDFVTSNCKSKIDFEYNLNAKLPLLVKQSLPYGKRVLIEPHCSHDNGVITSNIQVIQPLAYMHGVRLYNNAIIIQLIIIVIGSHIQSVQRALTFFCLNVYWLAMLASFETLLYILSLYYTSSLGR